MKNKKQKVYCLLMFILVFAFLTACSSAEETEPKEEANASTEGAAETEVEEAETTETTTETVAEETAESEPTAEPTPEPVVYEGIDMESTLPAAEWVQTFEGVFDEPVMVVFNDYTNKKVIVENGGEVDFALEDSFGIYIPRSGGKSISLVQYDIFTFGNIIPERFAIFSQINYESGDSVETKSVFKINGEEVTITATLHVQ